MKEAGENARGAADLHPDVLNVDQDRDGADLVVLRLLGLGSLAFGLAGPAGRQTDVFPATADLPRESSGPAEGTDESVPGAG